MNEQIRALFPAAQRYTYLNSAAIGPMPGESVRAVTSQLDDVSSNGSINMGEWSAIKDRVRMLIAEMLGARHDQIALTRNTSDGLSSAAAGMTWETGDNIVSIQQEFPANFYPWRTLKERSGVELRLCPLRDSRIDVEELTELIDGRTKLVTVSAVQYSCGFRIDLESIGRAARRADALFAVDIIQGLGVLPFDLPAQYVDIASGAGYKWLCSPEGCGFFYLNDRARERMHPVSASWMSVERPWNFDERDQPFRQSALAWENGMCGSALFYGMERSLRLLCGVGAGKIAAYLEDLTDFMCEILPARYKIVSSRRPGEKSQIVSVRPPRNLTAETVASHLLLENIVVSPRNGHIRIAPHFFNNYRDIERLVEFLP